MELEEKINALISLRSEVAKNLDVSRGWSYHTTELAQVHLAILALKAVKYAEDDSNRMPLGSPRPCAYLGRTSQSTFLQEARPRSIGRASLS